MTTHTFSISKKKQKDTVDDEDEFIDLEMKLMSGKICMLKRRLQNSSKKVILL